MEQRFEDLEFRLMHQELAIEQLSTQIANHEKTIFELRRQLDHVATLLQQLTPANVVDQSQETPPPHY